MSSEWIPFTELLTKIIDNRGKTCPVGEIGIPLIATNCINNSTLYPIYNTTRFVDQETYKNWFRGHPEPGDILFVCKGSPGRTNWVPDPVDFCIAQDMVAVRANPERIYPKYLFAALRSSIVLSQIDNMHVGTMIPHFKKGDFDKLKIPVLSSQEAQVFTGDLYFTISERIDGLQKTNATLEAIAQALFKSWFVDFDPVHAKARGEPPQGMDDATAALFPDSFEESELGMIPKGWRAGSLGCLALTARKQIKPEAMTADMLYVGLEHIPRQSLGLDSWGTANELESAKSCFEKGDILFGKLRPYFHKIVIAPFSGVCSTDILVCKAKSSDFHGVVAMHLFSTELVAYANRLSNGAKMPRVNWKDLADYPLAIPPSKVALAYSQTVQPMFEQITENVLQAQTLAQLRDTLLPKLISGQLRLPEAEALLAEELP